LETKRDIAIKDAEERRSAPDKFYWKTYGSELSSVHVQVNHTTSLREYIINYYNAQGNEFGERIMLECNHDECEMSDYVRNHYKMLVKLHKP